MPTRSVWPKRRSASVRWGGMSAFWTFHDLLYAKSPSSSLDTLAPLVQQSKVDAAAFRSCMAETGPSLYVKSQMQLGGAAGVTGTPTTFVVNNKTKEVRQIIGAVPFADFQATIERMLGKR